MRDLGIIIISWNVSTLLARCLNSIFASEGAFQYHVIVVDNASTDDSVELVNSRYPQAELLTNETNVGYSAANNMGLRALGFAGRGRPRPRYILLLNPDTELPPTALCDMLRYLDERPLLGAAGPKLILPDGSLDLACRRSFPSPKCLLLAFYRSSATFPA